MLVPFPDADRVSPPAIARKDRRTQRQRGEGSTPSGNSKNVPARYRLARETLSWTTGKARRSSSRSDLAVRLDRAIKASGV